MDKLMVDWVSVLISAAAILFAALTWLESRKQRQLLQTMVKAVPYVTRPRKRTTKKGEPKPPKPAETDSVKTAAGERRRLKVELEKEKLQWRKSKDVARAIAWFLDRMDETEDDYADE